MGKEYEKLNEDIRRFVLNKFNSRMEKEKVCIIVLPISIGKLIFKMQDEIIDWYIKNNIELQSSKESE